MAKADRYHRTKATLDDKDYRKGADSIKKQNKKIAESSESLLDRVLKLKTVLAGIGTAVASGLSAVTAFSRFETQVAQVAGIADKTKFSIEELTQAAKDQAKEFGSSPTKQMQTIYQIISANAKDAASAIATLRAANELMVAGGLQSSEQAANAITSVINSYQLSAEDIPEITDAMFKAVEKGKTTIGELASSMAKVVPQAASFGISLDEVLSAVAALTQPGESTSVVMTQLAAVFTAIIKPSGQANEMAKELGINFDVLALKTHGLAGFIEMLQEATGGSEEKMGQLFGSAQALNAALFLGGKGAKAFGDNLDAMADKAGATNNAVEIMQNTIENRWARTMARMEVLLINIGEQLRGSVLDGMEAVNKALEVLSKMDWKFIISAVKRLVTGLASLYVLKTISRLAKTTSLSILSVGKASITAIVGVRGFSGALSLLSLSVRALATSVKVLLGSTGIGLLLVYAPELLKIGVALEKRFGFVSATFNYLKDSVLRMASAIDTAIDAVAGPINWLSRQAAKLGLGDGQWVDPGSDRVTNSITNLGQMFGDAYQEGTRDEPPGIEGGAEQQFADPGSLAAQAEGFDQTGRVDEPSEDDKQKLKEEMEERQRLLAEEKEEELKREEEAAEKKKDIQEESARIAARLEEDKTRAAVGALDWLLSHTGATYDAIKTIVKATTIAELAMKLLTQPGEVFAKAMTRWGGLPGGTIMAAAQAAMTGAKLATSITVAKAYDTGGLVTGDSGRDTVNARVTPGEYIMNQKQVADIMDEALSRGASMGQGGGGDVVVRIEGDLADLATRVTVEQEKQSGR